MAPETRKNLVSVGQVFQIFPGKGTDEYPLDYIGINITGHPFAIRHSLTLRPPSTNGTDDVVVRVSTIEIKKQRSTKVEPGDKCAIRPNQKPEVAPDVGWEVLVRADQAAAAAGRKKVLTARPKPPAELSGDGHRRKSW